jgi:crossover junction endodeoxyribonuclease RusA
MITLELPWPDNALSPNSRKHWRAKARYQQDAHRQGWAVAREWLQANRPVFSATMPVTMIFCPPDKRSRDLDNLGASMKWTLDGIADALDLNDSRFRPVTSDLGAVCKPGKVVVTIGRPPHETDGWATRHQQAAEERAELAYPPGNTPPLVRTRG